MARSGRGVSIAFTDFIGDPIRNRRLLDPLYELFDISPPYLLDLLIALLVIVVSWVVGGWIVHRIGRPVARRFERPSVTRAVLESIRIGILIVGVLIGATIIGFSLSEILLSVTVFSAVLAVVMAPIVRRFISGMFVLSDQPFEIGDMIELVDTDTRGFVEDVTLRYTKIFTLENTFLVMSNSEVLNRDIINYSAEDKRTRQEFSVLITYESDLDRARALFEEAAAGVDGIISGGPPIRIGSTRYPAEPRCLIDDFADHGILLTLKYWVKAPYHTDRIGNQVRGRIWTAIEDEPVRMAYPHSHLVFDETTGQLDISVNESSDARE